ncbi:hypothetical protein ACQR7C_26510 (plasmid) [Salmonella enterica]|uniref:hypothetical protein n=1 Tax=Salmonella enterica TaxID=28901 RepID=UPI00328F65C0
MNTQNVNVRTAASESTERCDEKKKGFLVFGAVADIHEISSKRTPRRCNRIVEEDRPLRTFVFNNFMRQGCQRCFVIESPDDLTCTGSRLNGFLAGESFFGVIMAGEEGVRVVQYPITNRIRRYFKKHMTIADSHPAQALKTFTRVNLWRWRNAPDLYRLWEES